MFSNSNYKSTTRLICGIFLSLTFAAQSHAVETYFSGFANIGLTHSSSDTLEFRSSLLNDSYEGFSFAPDSILGFHSNTIFTENFDMVGQAIIQDRTNRHLSSFIELAFLRYRLNRSWTLKVGRFSTNNYLFTDFRYVGQAITWVRPPVEMYSPVGAVGNLDGIQANYVHSTSFGSISYSAGYGQSIFRNKDGADLFKLTYSDFLALSVELQANHWRIQAAYSRATVGDIEFSEAESIRSLPSVVPPIFTEYAQQINRGIIPDKELATYFSLGGQYNINNFDFAIEFADYKSEFLGAPSGKFGYVSVAKNIGKYTPYLTLGIHRRKDEPSIIDYDEAQQSLPNIAYEQLVVLTQDVNEFVRNASIDQQSISVGLKWDVSFDWTVKFQFDQYQTNESGSALFLVSGGETTPQRRQTINVSSINFSTTF